MDCKHVYFDESLKHGREVEFTSIKFDAVASAAMHSGLRAGTFLANNRLLNYVNCVLKTN